MAFGELTVRPIGVVSNQFKQQVPQGWEHSVSEVRVDARWEVALEGVEEFSHIVVLFWLDRVEGERALRVHPMGRPDAPLVGLFSTRTPRRPNPIGLTVVRLLERQGSVLRVEGLDALDGSPVLDLKPYLTRNDRAQGATMPDWVASVRE
jgi:tRNA-Thr(GGU) m(6)t(6)A37 methyltransferase TsaA